MVPQNLKKDCLKIYNIFRKVTKSIENTTENWRIERKVGRKSLTKVKIQRGIFQDDALPPLHCVIKKIRHNNILRKCTGR